MEEDQTEKKTQCLSGSFVPLNGSYVPLEWKLCPFQVEALSTISITIQ
jgi:hypothetical protein